MVSIRKSRFEDGAFSYQRSAHRIIPVHHHLLLTAES